MIYGRKFKGSGRLAKQKRDVFILKSGIVVLVLLLLLILLIHLSRLDRFQIKETFLEGNSITSSFEIEMAINENISGFYFKMFPRRNIFLYPRKKIEEDLLEEFKRLESSKII